MPKPSRKLKRALELQDTEIYDKITKLESEIISELSYLQRKRNQKLDCIHCYEKLSSKFDPSRNYYDEFWKAFLMNIILLKRYEEYKGWINKITKKITSIEKIYLQRQKIVESLDHNMKKKTTESDSQFQCTECGKNYRGSESLAIHISIKHQLEHPKLQKIQSIPQSKIKKPDRKQSFYQDD